MATKQSNLDYLHFSGPEGLEALIQKVDSLISVPDIYYRLEAAIQDPAATSVDYANLLSVDPDLCARLLRIANSAFYSFPVIIDKVDRAVNLVGLRQIRELVLATSIIQGFDQQVSADINIRQFWRHSIAVAVVARAIMRRAGMAGGDNCYIPGLLHDIGKLVLFMFIPALSEQLSSRGENGDSALHVIETQMLGYDHARLGGQLLQFWRVPESIWEPVICHHEPMSASEFTAINCALNLADNWVNGRGYENLDSDLDCKANHEAQDYLKLDEIDIGELWLTVEPEINNITRQFLSH